jgi:hypothetical protein
MANEFIARNGVISRGNVVVTGSLTTSGSLTTTGTITATTLVVQTITSSISSVTGSTNFGSLSSNTHTFTGSILASGSTAYFAGNVGIGTNTPGTKLEVYNATQGNVYISTSGSNESCLRFYSGGNELVTIRSTGNGTLGFETGTGSPAERMRITPTGSVGIGTTNPLALLDVCVLSSGARRLLVNYADSIVTVKSSNDSSNGENLRVWGDNIFFYTGSAGSGGELMRLTNTGRVGIGTSSPTQILDVNGPRVRMGDGGGFELNFNTSTFAAFQISSAEKMRITSAGFFKASNTGTYIGATDSFHEFSSNLNNTTTFRIKATSSIFTDYLLFLHADKANNSDYSFLQARSNNTSDTEFNLRGDGNAYADGSWIGGGADYAEFFEWLDGNPNNEDRRGYSVSLVGNKIKIAENGETIIGVISGNPSVIGDSAWNMWTEKYLRDDFGTYIRDENGFKVLNPNYNPDIDYIPREERPEWGIVGLMGKLCIRKGQEVMPNWIKMQDISENVEQWLIR